MRGGDLDREIVIQKSTPDQDENGTPLLHWEDLHKVWARYKPLPLKADETFIANQTVAQSNCEFEIRYQPDIAQISDVAATCRVIFEGNAYDIFQVLEIHRREGLNIRCRLRQTP